MMLDIVGGTFFVLGTFALLVIYLPFSPMTIDLVNLTRANQLKIFRHRKIFAAIGIASLAVTLIVGLLAGHLMWVALVVATSAMLGVMFWTGYVPWVMTAPRQMEILSPRNAARFINSDDTVLGLYHNGEARAYPRDLIARPHFVNDTVGGSALTISYCILCNSATAFIAEIEGRPLALECVTAFNNNIIYRDRNSGDIIQQLDAKVIEGPHRGVHLGQLPLSITTWAQWQELHPDTTLSYIPAATFRDKMVAVMLAFLIPVRKLAARSSPWHRVKGEIDRRLPAMSYVYGIEVGDDRRAYPASYLREHPACNDVLGGLPIVVLYDPDGEYGAIFKRVVDGRVLEFQWSRNATDELEIRDRQTNSRWNLAGRAIDGELRHTELEQVPHFNKIFWFSWGLFRPGTSVAGGT